MQVQNAQAQAAAMQPPMPGGPQGSPAQMAQDIQHPTAINAAFDPRGPAGIMARGPNVYMGGLPAAPGAGRPRNPTPAQGDMSSPAMQQAIQNRMRQYATETNQHEAATARRRGA
jgi:hypothetical protein